MADPAALKLKSGRRCFQRRLKILYHASVTLSLARDADSVGFCSAQDSTYSRCDGLSTWALRVVPCRTLGKPAETSHSLANQTAHRHRRLGRYSPWPSRGYPSRPRRPAYAELTGRLPLSSQYASSVPIRCILNASRADCTGWPCWRRRFSVLIRLHDPFASRQASFEDGLVARGF